MRRQFYIIYTFVVLSLGFVAGFLYSQKRQIDSLLQPRVASQSVTQPTYDKSQVTASVEATPQTKHILHTEIVQSIKSDNKNLRIQDYSLDQAKTIINDMPDYLLHQYIDKFMAKGTSDVIQDKRKFATRAIEELYSQNNNTPLRGDITLSFSHEMPNVSVDTSRITKKAKLYAHLNTHGRVPASPFVFVKWVDNATGQILLFEKKDILASSQTNWVNMTPHDGWKAGSYDIKFYQFNDALEPIAQLTYDIYEVVE